MFQSATAFLSMYTISDVYIADINGKAATLWASTPPNTRGLYNHLMGNKTFIIYVTVSIPSSTRSVSPSPLSPSQCHQPNCLQFSVTIPIVTSSVSPSPQSPGQRHYPHCHQFSVTVTRTVSAYPLSSGQCQHPLSAGQCHHPHCHHVNVIIPTVTRSVSSGHCHHTSVSPPAMLSPSQCLQVTLLASDECHRPCPSCYHCSVGTR